MSRGLESSYSGFERHMKMTKERYGSQVIVNLLGTSLIGSKEGEATLSQFFQVNLFVNIILLLLAALGGLSKTGCSKTKI